MNVRPLCSGICAGQFFGLHRLSHWLLIRAHISLRAIIIFILQMSSHKSTESSYKFPRAAQPGNGGGARIQTPAPVPLNDGR